jgi:LPXTG-motif cell wall-anchored protein
MILANQIGSPVTTDASGAVLFTDLQLSNFYNNATQTDLHTYCLVETKAPVGYNLNAQPIPFTVTVEGDVTNLAYTVGTADAQEVQVANEPSNLGNNLPLTGGAGVAAVSIVGLLLVGGGLGYYLVGARRREIEQDV